MPRTPRGRRTGWSAPPTGRRARVVRALPGVESLEIETPSLEEIYVGYMRARRPEPAPPLAVHVA